MKFLFNAPCYKPAYKQGGPLHSVSSLAEGLVQAGHEVVVSAPNLDLGEHLDVDLGRDYDFGGVRVRFFNAAPTVLQRTGIPYFARAGVYAVDPAYEAWLEVEAAEADVLHSHLTFIPENAPVSKYAIKHNKVYFYSQRGNLDPVRLEMGRWKKLAFIYLREQLIMRRADALLGLTRHEIKTFKRFAPRTRVEVIPNGISAHFSGTPAVDVSPSITSILSQVEDLPVFFWMSRIHQTKGADVFVDAAILALNSGAKFHAVVSGPDEAGLEDDLKGRVRGAKLGEYIHFTGPVSGDNRLALLKRADCFALPTVSEGLSMVILEAMACGCAILTSPGAYFDEIEVAGAGRILDRTVSAFSSAIEEYSSLGRAGLETIGVRGVDLIQSGYTWDSIVTDYVDLSKQIIKMKSVK